MAEKEVKNTEKVFAVTVEGKTIILPMSEQEAVKTFGLAPGATAYLFTRDFKSVVSTGNVTLKATWNHNYQGVMGGKNENGQLTKEFPSKEKALELLESMGDFPGEFIMKLSESGSHAAYFNNRNTYLTATLKATLRLR